MKNYSFSKGENEEKGKGGFSALFSKEMMFFILMNFKLHFFLVVALTAATDLYAQWERTNGPYASPILCFAVNRDTVFAGTDGYGIFISTKGSDWTNVNGAYWWPNQLGITRIHSLIYYSNNLLAG